MDVNNVAVVEGRNRISVGLFRFTINHGDRESSSPRRPVRTVRSCVRELVHSPFLQERVGLLHVYSQLKVSPLFRDFPESILCDEFFSVLFQVCVPIKYFSTVTVHRYCTSNSFVFFEKTALRSNLICIIRYVLIHRSIYF